MKVRLVDSATGASIHQGTVRVRAQDPAAAQSVEAPASRAREDGVPVAPGIHSISARAPGYAPLSGNFEMQPDNPYEIRFLLDPLTEPEQTRIETINTLRREGFMLLQGFVVDDASGELLQGVAVTDPASGQVVSTDVNGFFRLHLHVPPADKPVGALRIEMPDYQARILQGIELWSQGDCTFQLRLQREKGGQRRSESSLPAQPDAAPLPTAAQESPALAETPRLEFLEPPEPATLPQNATVRVPRNIRVLQTNNVTIDYVSLTYYTRAVLASEWIPSWGNIPGGTNSLNAGAVAIRCYAIAAINSATTTSAYDICGTSACQVYNPYKIHSLTDAAVYYTLDWVLLNGLSIARTEYSAENNSLGPDSYPCADGFTAPTGSCLYDPICAGQTRYGHGRGMCQWGTARWATGRKMNNRVSGDTTPSGFPLRDWKWIVQHYYPSLTLIKGTSLVLGDDVRALQTLDVRSCPGGQITNGTACPLLLTKSTGAQGVIIGGPQTVTTDGRGFTWYQVDWGDVVGWSIENRLERVFPLPSAPTSLTATALSGTQIRLAWTAPTDVEAGFIIERAPASSGPWVTFTNLPADTSIFTDATLLPGNIAHYRVKAFNAGGASAYSPIASAQTLLPGPVIGTLNPVSTPEETLFTRRVIGTVTDFIAGFADPGPFPSETANGVVLFRTPGYSGSTQPLLDATPDILAVTDSFPTAGHGPGKVLRARFSFASAAADPWLRLTTSGTANYPNPVIPLTNIVRFKIYSDKSIGVAIGCRETTVAFGTPIGANGGSTGGIEWVGVTNKSGNAPVPTRIIPAGVWTTLSFDLATDPILNYASGNGVLFTASGLGTLEHVAIVPRAGAGEYNVYMSDFQVEQPRDITWSLDASPVGMSIDPDSGMIAWVPSEAQGPGSFPVQLVATTILPMTLHATNAFTVTVDEVNRPPMLDPVQDRIVYAGATVSFTGAASDPDLPANALTFSLEAAPAQAQVNPNTGLFSWPTTPQQADTTNSIQLRVSDDGSPQLTSAQTFTVSILAPPQLMANTASPDRLIFSWQALPGRTYSVQFKDSLTDSSWQLLTNVTASSSFVSITNDMPGPHRFFRLATDEP